MTSKVSNMTSKSFNFASQSLNYILKPTLPIAVTPTKILLTKPECVFTKALPKNQSQKQKRKPVNKKKI